MAQKLRHHNGPETHELHSFITSILLSGGTLPEMELQPERMRPLRQGSPSEPTGTVMFSRHLAIPPTMAASKLTSSLALSLVYCEALEDHLTSVNLEFFFCELEIRASALLSSAASVDEAMRGEL